MSYFPVGAAGTALGVQAVAASGAALALGFTASARETSFAVTLGQNCTITIGSGAAGVDQVMTIDLIQGGGGGFTPSFGNVSWAGGIAPAFNTAPTKRDTVQVRAVGSDISGYPVSMGRLPMVAAVPGSPSGIAVTPGVGQNSISGPAVVAYPAVSGYTIWRSTTPGTEGIVAPIVMNASLPYSDTGLTAATRYYYVVAAVNPVGTGPLSAEVSGTPLAAASAPGAPGSISAAPADGLIVVSAAAVSAAPAVTGYTVYRGTVAGGESAAPVAANVSLPYTDAGLVNGVPYFYKVAAVNSVGTGPQSGEASGSPVASAAHYASFTGANQAIYASPSAALNPGGSAFDLCARVRMASWATGGAVETNLVGCWDAATPASRLWRFGLTTDGRLRASWATGASSFPTAVSGAVIGAAGGTDLWLRAVVTPTTGAVAFYTGVDGVSWTALGAGQTANGSGAVYVPGTLPYLVLGQNASGGVNGSSPDQFLGRFIEAQLLIGGTLVTDPVMGPSSTVDSKGFSYGTSSGVAYT